MSFYLLLNNLHFAFGMIGAIALLMSTWLIWDSYNVQKNSQVLLRLIGFCSFFIYQIMHTLDSKNDLVLYFGYLLLVLGLVFIVISFLQSKQLSMSAVVVIPSFTTYIQQLSSVSTVLFFAISYLAFRQWKIEYNKSWKPFATAFFLFGLGYSLNIFNNGVDRTSLFYIAQNLLVLSGSISLGVWVWQYMKLRISESMVMMLVGITFILSTVVTLAFSTILVERVTNETSNELAKTVKLIDFTIEGLKKEALSKTELIASDTNIVLGINNNDFTLLDKNSGLLLEKYNLDFLIVTDRNGSVLVRGNALSKRGDSLSGEKSFEEALLKNSIVTIEDSQAEGFSVRAGSPVYDKNKKLIGTIVAGFSLDNAFTDRMNRLTGFEIFIYKDDLLIAGSAFGLNGRTRITGSKITDPAVMERVFGNAEGYTHSTDINGISFQTSYLPLLNSDSKVVGMVSSAKLQQDIVNVANAANRLTLITVLLILLMLIFPIYLVSKKMTGDRN